MMNWRTSERTTISMRFAESSEITKITCNACPDHYTKPLLELRIETDGDNAVKIEVILSQANYEFYRQASCTIDFHESIELDDQIKKIGKKFAKTLYNRWMKEIVENR